MAVFEKRKSSKLTLDDTITLTCSIEAAQNLESHTDYVIRVQRGPNPENSWQINRRYSDFVTLHDGLKVSGMELGLPPKKVFGNMEREFIAERQQALQGYLNRILSHQLLSSCFLVKRFLDPTNYAPNSVEDALQHVSMFFRSEPHWDVVEPLRDIGWRIRKTYFMVRPKSQPKVKQVLAWSYYGPDKDLDYKDLVPIMKLLPTIQHPFIYPVTYVSASDSGGLAIRTFHGTGTLKDFICKAKPKAHYMKKYCLPKSYTAFNIMNIKSYGRMILEALKFLHEKGLPYGHLHAGNVILEGNACRLLDIENTLLGLPFFYRGYLSHFRKINTTEAVDVYSFGHVLYEMTFGSPLNVASKDDFPHTIPPPIKSVLESILTTEACKTKLPTVDDLLADPLFSDVTFPERDRPQFRIPSKLKEPLKAAKSEVEKRLQEDSRVVSSFRRLSKAQAHHNSDEEKRRRKKAHLKKRMSEQNIGEANNSTPPAQTNGNHAGNGAVPTPPPPSTPAQPPPESKTKHHRKKGHKKGQSSERSSSTSTTKSRSCSTSSQLQSAS
ncbi:PX domain-containing protein kinase-like protein isoform X2 [Strongylocentrotus purpuratus]|uniref:PX domain-containing protein kinase-like protein n=1 Tax=Strongylocentrotus purpuratus TaxID=7668 RepID=A0A7M7MXE2_STRPU|nr:PX domain-containing protein kinase-like protein isoform X2 [Strongylocentrotus purpuratus]